jgi:hypothetical protein
MAVRNPLRWVRWTLVTPVLAALILIGTWGTKPVAAVLVLVGLFLAGSVLAAVPVAASNRTVSARSDR